MRRAANPYSQALLDYWQGNVKTAYTIRREDGFSHSVEVASSYARPPFSPLEELTLERCRGRVLDVGAGVGRHSLALQDRGCVVAALELESDLVAIMSERGVADAITGNVFSLVDRQFDSILMLMNGFGIFGTLSGAAAFFEHARNLLSPGGQILCDSLDVRLSTNPLHFSYQETNLHNGRPAGQMRFWIEYLGQSGQAFDWLHMDFNSLQHLARTHGMSAEKLAHEEGGHFLARLVYDEAPTA